jgi:thymidylate kinase
MAIAERAPQRVVPVDAADAIAKVQQKIARVVDSRLFAASAPSNEKDL